MKPVLVFLLAICLATRTTLTAQDAAARLAELDRAIRGGDATKAFELAKLGEAALPALVRLLDDASLADPVRYMAANALGESGLPAAAPPLLRSLGDESFNVRRCAAEALARLGAREAIPRLHVLAANDPFVWQDPQGGGQRWLVRESAVKALQAFGEKPPALPVRKRVFWQQPRIETGTPVSDTIPWAETLEAALAEAKKAEKLVLATVVAVGDARWSSGFEGAAKHLVGLEPHPFGDARAQQIDEGLVKERAMMAALFTDPDVVAVVRRGFVAVRLRVHTYDFDRATAQEANDPLRLLGTSGVACPPPALVFADADGKLLHQCCRMGVLHAPLLRATLRAVLERAGRDVAGPAAPPGTGPLELAWRAFTGGDDERVLTLLDRPRAGAHEAEAEYLRGLAAARLGRDDDARARFESARAADPTGPWGSRAALRLQPRGIALEAWESLTVTGFEPLATTTERTVSPARLPQVIADAVTFLLQQQRGDGGFGDPFVDPHPLAGPGSPYDMTVPRTALVVHALLAAAPRVPELKARVERAIARGIDKVGAFADAPKEHIWHLTYALHLQLELLRARRGDPDVARQRAARLIEALAAQQKSGGWSYMPPPRIHSFNTALVLLLLAESEGLGLEVRKPVIADAVALLERLRNAADPREYRYALNVDHRSVKASSCRSTLCELALAAATKAPSAERLGASVELFFAHEPEVRAVTKVFESYFAVGPLHDAYHYYFGHYYTARALALLPAADAKRHAARQRDVLLAQVEIDGSFVDAQMQGKAYSTAMALLALCEDQKRLE